MLASQVLKVAVLQLTSLISERTINILVDYILVKSFFSIYIAVFRPLHYVLPTQSWRKHHWQTSVHLIFDWILSNIFIHYLFALSLLYQGLLTNLLTKNLNSSKYSEQIFGQYWSSLVIIGQHLLSCTVIILMQLTLILNSIDNKRTLTLLLHSNIFNTMVIIHLKKINTVY